MFDKSSRQYFTRCIGKWLALLALAGPASTALADDALPADYEVATGVIIEYLADASRFTLLDARSEEEYQAAHIEGAISMPRDRIDELASALPSDTDAMIVTYCQTGARANLLKLELQDRGYSNVHILEPEQVDWSGDKPIFKAAVLK